MFPRLEFVPVTEAATCSATQQKLFLFPNRTDQQGTGVTTLKPVSQVCVIIGEKSLFYPLLSLYQRDFIHEFVALVSLS